MPIDPSVAIGADLGSRTFSWAESDMPWPCMPSRKVVS